MSKNIAPLPHRLEILDIPFDRITLNESIKIIQKWLEKSTKQHHVATPNPEILLKTLDNPKYKKIIQHTDLNIPDGIGIIWAATYLSKIKLHTNPLFRYLKGAYLMFKFCIQKKSFQDSLPERVTGTDLMNNIILQSTKNNSAPPRIFLLGADNGIAEKVQQHYQNIDQKINIIGTYSGSPDISDEQKIVSLINKTHPDILFVAFGAPNQETWINRNLHKMPSIKIAIGIGGAFDFIAGKQKRAPKWIRNIGLEWLYRLIQQPSRIKRIYHATIKFPLTIIHQGKPL